jgi:cytochrome c heme-lyase
VHLFFILLTWQTIYLINDDLPSILLIIPALLKKMSCPRESRPSSECPMHKTVDKNFSNDRTSQEEGILNPLTQMPYAADLARVGTSSGLSSERETSKIPRAVPDTTYPFSPVSKSACPSSAATRQQSATPHEGSAPQQGAFWVYPSAQMFHAALERKGQSADPQDVPAMLAIHNALNEHVWEEVLAWEADTYV